MTAKGDSVWVVTAVGVYEHGVQFVGLDEDAAREFCHAFSFDHDGYHRWRIREMPIGVPAPDLLPPIRVAEHRAAADANLRGRGFDPPEREPWPIIEVELWDRRV